MSCVGVATITRVAARWRTSYSATTWRRKWPRGNHWRKAFDATVREAACPCCRNGISLDGKTCSECKGKGLACIAYEHGRYQWKTLVTRLGGNVLGLECGHGVSFKEPCEDCGAAAVFGEDLSIAEKVNQ